MSDKDLVSKLSKKCILCRSKILDKSQPFLFIKDTQDIQSWNEESLNSLCDVLFKSKTNTETDNLKTILRQKRYCTRCRQSIWDIDLLLQMITSLESKLKKLTNQVISDISRNHEKSVRLYESNQNSKESQGDEIVEMIFNALDTADIQRATSISRFRKCSEKIATTTAISDFDNSCDDYLLPSSPLLDVEEFIVKQEQEEEQLEDQDDDSEKSFVFDPDEKCETILVEYDKRDNNAVESDKDEDEVCVTIEDLLAFNKNELNPPTTKHALIRNRKKNKVVNKNKKILNVGELRKQTGTHFPKKTFKCYRCGKSCCTFTVLNTHMRSHTGENPYKCKTCSKGFAQSSDRNNHKNIHTG